MDSERTRQDDPDLTKVLSGLADGGYDRLAQLAERAGLRVARIKFSRGGDGACVNILDPQITRVSDSIVVPLNVPALDSQKGFLNPEVLLAEATEMDRAINDPNHTWAEQEARSGLILAHCAAAYRRYAADFTNAVLAAAGGVPGLALPVRVETVTEWDRDNTWQDREIQNPGAHSDRLVRALWDFAFAVTPRMDFPDE